MNEVTTIFNETGLCVREVAGREVRRWQGQPVDPTVINSQTANVGEVIPVAPFVAGSETSHAAAVRADSNAASQRARILAYITKKGTAGAIDDEGEVALDLPSQSYCPRRRELEQAGAIFRTSLRRETRTGSHAFAYCLRQTERQDGLSLA